MEEERIKKVLEDEVRPYLQREGGDVEFVEFTSDKVLKIRLKGACGTCPMAMFTITGFVERVVKSRVPEVERVEAV